MASPLHKNIPNSSMKITFVSVFMLVLFSFSALPSIELDLLDMILRLAIWHSIWFKFGLVFFFFFFSSFLLSFH